MDQWFMAAAACGDSIIWITDPGGHFMKLDIKTNRVEYIQPLRDMAMQLYRSSVLCVKDRVAYFVANMGKYLIRLFIDGNYFETIQIDCEKMQLDMYAGVLFDGEDLIILPIYSDEYVCINLGTKRVVRKKMGLEVGKTQIRVGPRQFLAKNDQRFQNKMYLLTSGSRRLVTVYKDIREMCETTLPDCIGEAVDFEEYEGYFYILNSENEVYQYGNGSCERLCFLEGDSYGCIHLANGVLWIFPAYAEKIYRVFLKDRTLEEFTDYPGDYQYTAPETMAKFFYKCQAGKKTYLAMHSGNYIFSVNDQTGEGCMELLTWPSIEERLGEIEYQKRDRIYEVKGSMELKDYLDCIINGAMETMGGKRYADKK